MTESSVNEGPAGAAGNGAAQGPYTFWDQQYLKGHNFGEEPSQTVKTLTHHLRYGNSHILDVGHGPYPRDTLELVRQGHRVVGVEESSVASSKAMLVYDSFEEHAKRTYGTAEFLRTDFKRASLGAGDYHGATCHRVIHLIHPRNRPAFANALYRAVEVDGVIAISARDHRDYDPEQMTKIGSNTVEVKSRPGHIINLWSPDTFIAAFKTQFNIVAFHLGQEPESNNKPNEPTHFLIMVATKKAEPSDSLVITPAAWELTQAYRREHKTDVPETNARSVVPTPPVPRGGPTGLFITPAVA